MIKTPVTIRNLMGLHARVANMLAQESAQFKSVIELEDPITAHISDAKSIMQLLMMGAGNGTELILRIHGEDQDQASKVLKALFHSGFGEPCG